jgi:hypothetical protein
LLQRTVDYLVCGLLAQDEQALFFCAFKNKAPRVTISVEYSQLNIVEYCVYIS